MENPGKAFAHGIVDWCDTVATSGVNSNPSNHDKFVFSGITMRMSLEHERLVRMLKESISLMCKSSLNYNLELSVEGLLGITLDKKDIFLVNINECFKSDNVTAEPEESEEERHTSRKRSQSETIEIKGEDEGPSSCHKRRRRRRSRNGSPGTQCCVDNNAHQ